MTDIFGDGLASVAPDLSHEDAYRLLLAVEAGHVYPSPRLDLLVDLGYLWGSQVVLYPSVKGQLAAVGLARLLWERVEAEGDGTVTVAYRTIAYSRYNQLRMAFGTVDDASV